MQPLLSNHRETLCCSPRVSPSSLGKKTNKKKIDPQTKASPLPRWVKKSEFPLRVEAGSQLLLGVLLLSLLRTIFTGLLLLFAALVLFVLVAPVTLPLLALVLFAVVGKRREKKKLPRCLHQHGTPMGSPNSACVGTQRSHPESTGGRAEAPRAPGCHRKASPHLFGMMRYSRGRARGR